MTDNILSDNLEFPGGTSMYDKLAEQCSAFVIKAANCGSDIHLPSASANNSARPCFCVLTDSTWSTYQLQSGRNTIYSTLL